MKKDNEVSFSGHAKANAKAKYVMPPIVCDVDKLELDQDGDICMLVKIEWVMSGADTTNDLACPQCMSPEPALKHPYPFTCYAHVAEWISNNLHVRDDTIRARADMEDA